MRLVASARITHTSASAAGATPVCRGSNKEQKHACSRAAKCGQHYAISQRYQAACIPPGLWRSCTVIVRALWRTHSRRCKAPPCNDTLATSAGQCFPDRLDGWWWNSCATPSFCPEIAPLGDRHRAALRSCMCREEEVRQSSNIGPCRKSQPAGGKQMEARVVAGGLYDFFQACKVRPERFRTIG